ncbi:Lysyl oxidase 2 [Orchesella cincta]|uniref:Lysyl oxidase 2 n=1 Tax=Orchesella cincta TaxID=48709 RepID=A0A1D2MQ37_ORCCI|nr:Lysyl oxidase 2 [Orchesella cincta]
MMEWGLICGDGWSLLEGAVICRQLNLGFAQDAPQTDYFGGEISDIVTTGVKCSGQENELAECYHHDLIPNATLVCPGNGRNFATVICTDRLPDLVPDAYEVQRSTYLEDKQLYFLQCAMEENCLSTSAYRYQNENHYGWHLETRRLLRFTARIVNKGNADFRPAIPKHLWEFHACHIMEVFAIFDVLDQYGKKVAEGHKASFCLEDNECVAGTQTRYACANYGDQGIQVGCADIYRSNIDCQWIDMTDVLPGLYTFKISINAEMKVAESDFSNNAVVCTLHYSEAFALVSNCSLTQP